MTKMIATIPFKYGTRALQPNEEFDAENDEHAVCLEAANKAKRAVGGAGQGYKTRQLLAERTQDGQPLTAPQIGKPRRNSEGYRRRDLKAKDE